jgi:hypothetical protein
MKLLKEFADLTAALAYIGEINTAYQAQIGEVTTLSNKSTELQKQVDKYKPLADDASAVKGELDAARGTILSLQEQLKASQSATAQAIEEIGELGKKLSLQESHGSEGLVVSIGKNSYQLIGDSFIYGGSSKTAKELSQDQDQLELMLKKGSGSLVEITS